MPPLKYSTKIAETGAALIEFAIIAPLLLTLVIGISEFSYAYYHLNTLNKSVQDGARYFSDPQRARVNGASSNLTWAINTNTATNLNVAKTQNLIIYGNTAGVGNPLLPNVGYYSIPIIPSVVGVNLDHINVTATYDHNLMTSNLLSALMSLISGGNATVGPVIRLTASSVMRVEGG